jgi:ubiquinone/menaquinone biosynthesis C-methylase UbiE
MLARQGLMTSPTQFDKSAYYAPLPMLAIDVDGRVCDFNVACEVLMRDDISASRMRDVAEVLEQIGNRCNPPFEFSRLYAPERDPVARSCDQWTLRYKTPLYGTAIVRCFLIDIIDPETGSPLGPTTYLRIEALDENEAYIRDFLQERRNELLWEQYAVSYDRVLLKLDYYQETIDRHVSALDSSTPMKVLDIGAGTGNVAIRLAKSGHDVIAIDSSRAMTDKLRSKTVKSERGRLQVIQQNAEWLPQCASDSFDAANILLVLFDMDHPQRGLSEAIRVLRPGGAIVITEPKESIQLERILAEVKRGTEGKGLEDDVKRVFDANAHFDERFQRDRKGRQQPDRDARLWAEKVLDELTERGFRDLTIVDSHFSQCATVVGLKPSNACGSK